MIRMSLRRLASQPPFGRTPSLEQHDRHINSLLPRFSHPVTQSLEIPLIELFEIKVWFAVQRLLGSRPAVRIRFNKPVVWISVLSICPRRPARLLPGPQPNEV